MQNNPEFISNFIEDQFPEMFKECNSEIVQFILAYYEWLETNNQTKVLYEDYSIDQTGTDPNSSTEWARTS